MGYNKVPNILSNSGKLAAQFLPGSPSIMKTLLDFVVKGLATEIL
jgi:hypothetical protein